MNPFVNVRRIMPDLYTRRGKNVVLAEVLHLHNTSSSSMLLQTYAETQITRSISYRILCLEFIGTGTE